MYEFDPSPTADHPIAKRLEYVRREIAGLSLRAFHRKLQKQAGLSLSYAAARNYHFDRESPVEYLVCVSQVFSVRLEWLATESGPVEKGEAWDFRERFSPKLKAAVLGGLGLPQHEVQRGETYTPSWAAPLTEVWTEMDTPDVQAIGAALRGPLEAFDLDVEGMTPPDGDSLRRYLIAMASILLMLAGEGRRQRRRMNALVDGLPEDEANELREALAQRKRKQEERSRKELSTEENSNGEV